MSRTYRKVPHFVSKRELADDFHTRSFYHGRGRLRNAATEKDFVKIAMARYRSDAMGRDGLSDTFRVSVNGKPLGYSEFSRSGGWAKLYANKKRRNNDKIIVAGAIDEMIEDFDVAMQELVSYEDDYRNYEDCLKEMNDIDWDDRFMFDDPYEEPYYNDRWDDYDPWY